MITFNRKKDLHSVERYHLYYILCKSFNFRIYDTNINVAQILNHKHVKKYFNWSRKSCRELNWKICNIFLYLWGLILDIGSMDPFFGDTIRKNGIFLTPSKQMSFLTIFNKIYIFQNSDNSKTRLKVVMTEKTA